MKPLFLLAGLLATGCAHADEEPLSLVDNPHYQAMGWSPVWQLAIGDEDIALKLGHGNFTDSDVASVVHRFPRPGARHIDGGRRWHSPGRGGPAITVEARPGPCDFGRGPRFEDVVKVRLGDREFNGCGGRLLEKGRP